MIEILSLKPEDKERLNPHARERFETWHDDILRKIPQLAQLKTEHLRALLKTYLCDNELTEFNKCLDDVRRWLSDCMDTGDTYLPNAYATWVIHPMSRVESLMVGAYRRAEAEQRLKEYDKKWRTAFVAMKPPTDDVEKYLNDTEQDEFVLAVDRAIGAYLEKGPAYLNDIRAMDYMGWLKRIQERKNEEAQKLQAIDEASKYNHRLNQEIRKLASRLDYERRDLADYFRANIQDKRYRNYSFDYVLSEENEMNLDATLVRVANKRLEQLLSNDLRHFISLPSRYYRLYFPLPIATYRLERVPCIDIGFEVFAAAYAKVCVEPGTKEFNGYEFDLPWMEERNCLIRLEKARFLAYHHLILKPEDLGGYVLWRSIPLILLRGLLNGETRPDGCTLSAASDNVTAYRIQGLKAEVEVPDEFVEYLKSIGSIDEMIGTGIMSEKVGNIVKAALSEPEIERKAPPSREKGTRRDSWKERAFQLFDEGRRPSHPAVKGLGIRPSTAYRYYQEWKRTQN
ncbi:MAG: hypothetical protein R6V59_02395 [Dehalococcoidia bacterium]